MQKLWQKHRLTLKHVLLLSFALLIISSLTSCASVHLKDAEWCADAGELGASCFNTLSDGGRDLDKAAWDTLRFGQVCTEAASFANWKAALLKFCRSTGACTYEVKKAAEKLTARATEHAEKAKAQLR